MTSTVINTGLYIRSSLNENENEKENTCVHEIIGVMMDYIPTKRPLKLAVGDLRDSLKLINKSQ